MEFGDKCVVVTGGGHGIGRAFAERFAREGAHVVVADLDGARAEKIAARVGGLAVVVDVGRREDVAMLVRRAVDAYGPVDVFCSNAGILGPGDGLRTEPGELERTLAINALAHVWAAEEVVPSMVERGGGHLVQTLSAAALITANSPIGYTMSKHAAIGFAEWLWLNYAHLGVKVTCLCPTAVNTGFTGRNEDDESTATKAKEMAAATNLGDVIEPEECVDVAFEAMRAGRFLALPNPRVGTSFARKAQDYDDWLRYTNIRIRRMRGEDV